MITFSSGVGWMSSRMIQWLMLAWLYIEVAETSKTGLSLLSDCDLSMGHWHKGVGRRAS
jgi:hypothetical protein